jgi:uncharacterized protein with HEPN domain
MPPDDSFLLRTILRSCEDALSFSPPDSQGFFADEKSQAAVMHRLLVLGVAAKRLSLPFKQSHAGLPWRACGKLRDRLAHDMYELEVERIWDALTYGIPPLRTAVLRILAD